MCLRKPKEESCIWQNIPHSEQSADESKITAMGTPMLEETCIAKFDRCSHPGTESTAQRCQYSVSNKPPFASHSARAHRHQNLERLRSNQRHLVLLKQNHKHVLYAIAPLAQSPASVLRVRSNNVLLQGKLMNYTHTLTNHYTLLIY